MIVRRHWTRIRLLVTQVAFIIVAGCVSTVANDTEKLVSLKNGGETTNQSVTFRGQFMSYTANRAIDGDVETCSRTASAPPRWWRLTLENPVNVSRILVIGGNARSGQALDMEKVNVTVSFDDQSPFFECELSDSPDVQDDREWSEFKCDVSDYEPIKIIHISDLRKMVTELSLCEIKLYERIDSNFATSEQANLTSEQDSKGQGSLTQHRTSVIILTSICNFLLLMTSVWP